MAEIIKISFEWSQKLGVRELPELSADYESNVPGLYVVGDLADAPIIKVALNQGYDVAQKIAAKLQSPTQQDGVLDVLIVGAGPAGIGAALALEQAKMRYVVLEREQPFNTIQNFPKSKLIFSEPHSIENRGGFWFEDAAKEELIERWGQALDERRLKIRQPEEVVEVRREGDTFVVKTKVATAGLTPAGEPVLAGLSDQPEAENSYRARRVILAIGRRGSVNKLGVPGEQLDKVAYALKDPEDHRGRNVLVVGGGDSAVEAALSCAKAGANVTISYRSAQFSRTKAANRQAIDTMIAGGQIRGELGTTVKEIRQDSILLERKLQGTASETVELPNDDVLVFIGTKLPSGFLKRLGIRMAGQMDFWRAAWIVSFAVLTYLFYVLKSKKPYFPFGPGHLLEGVPKALEVDLGFRTVNGSFWGTCVYAVLILFFGLRAYRKYSSPLQKKRYLSLITFQWIFLFGIPEIIAPLVIKLGQTVPELLARGYKFYAVSVPWPLSIWSAIDGPGWGAGEGVKHVSTNITWIVVGLVVAFVLVPLYVRKQGQRFCSYLCGCGGLAETLGDLWRHLAPRGSTSYKAEWFGRATFFLAVPVTLLILNDAWGFFARGSLHHSAEFAKNWYGLVVDFWLASVVGVAFYPYLGNRVWCRFFCPLRAYMELLARRFAKITIKANSHCIGCGECTRFCQMGIQVQKFAQQQIDMDNSNSSCIQCGICVQVCPMEVLTVGTRDLKNEKKAPLLAPLTGPR